MVENGFLQVFDLTLKPETPLFVGSGKTIPKKSYLYEEGKHTVAIFDETTFFHFLLDHDLVDEYESFMMNASQSSLYQFLRDNNCLDNPDLIKSIRYNIQSREALDDNHSPMDIHSFMRDAYGRAYIPGSSVKGALRTVYLQSLIKKELSSDKSLIYSDIKGNVRMKNFPESDYLHILNCKKNNADAINSILRGVQISDSLPIPDSSMTLTSKYDVKVNGTYKHINVCRESVQPKTEIRFKLTLDQNILKYRITKDTLVQSIKDFDAYYRNTYMRKFSSPSDNGSTDFKNDIILGGGSGFFSKSLIYPYLGEKRALSETARYMESKFTIHKHAGDIENGISPHTMNYTKYKGLLYPMGFCTVTIS